jgi:hypothetical protein
MPPRRTASSQAKAPVTPVRDEPCGSGQSQASLERDRAAQPRLLAAAGKGKGKARAHLSTPIRKRKNDFFKFKSSVPGSSSSSSKSSKNPSAMFDIVKAKYMKGEHTGQETGNVYFNGKPAYGENDEFKNKVMPLLLCEPMRWSHERKFYTAKIYNAIQAKKMYNAMMTLSTTSGLPDEAEADTIIDAAFEGITPAEIEMSEVMVDGVEMFGIRGSTFPFKDKLKEIGFAYNKEVNGDDTAKMWLAKLPLATEKDELINMFQEYGFTVTIYDEDDSEDEPEP